MIKARVRAAHQMKFEKVHRVIYQTLSDYHVHTRLCGHATGEPEEYVLAALNAGLGEIGFAEHIPMYWLPPDKRDPAIAMPLEQFEFYVDTVLRLRDNYPEIRILLGVEADFIPGQEHELQRLLEPYPWDYVYGSVHYIGDWGFDNPAYSHRYDEWDLISLYDAYFDLVLSAARTELFDIMGHLDVIKKWGHRLASDPRPLYANIAAALAQSRVVVEVSTAGYRKPAAELYPAPQLLQALAGAGVPITLGSDAHAPVEVGQDFGRALDEVRAAGHSSLVRFEGRRRRVDPIPVRD